MSVLLIFVGLMQIVSGVIVWAIAKSAVHEILGSISIGFGILCVPLAMIMRYVSEIRDMARGFERERSERRRLPTADATARPQIPLNDPAALAPRR